MYNAIFDIVTKTKIGWLTDNAELVSYIASLIAIVLIIIAVKYIAKLIIVKVVARIAKKTKQNWDDIMLKNKLFHRLSNIAIPVILAAFNGTLPQYNHLLGIASSLSIVIIMMLLTDSLLNSVEEIYRSYEISKARPIKSLLQVIKVVVFILSGIFAVAILIGQSPLVLLGGLGAMTAVTSLIFKDSILGFVAGIQLTANDMIRIGDWVEMPNCSADGTVIELSLTTVKVRNFDNSITSIPAYTMVSEAFINWRGMEVSGGRRIKRAIHINTDYIRLCDEEMIERFRKIELLKDYIDSKLFDIAKYNEERGIDMSDPVNGRRITNIGTFRAYIVEYLKQHTGIRHDMTMLVRQLAPDDKGLPIEVYAFTDTSQWGSYENIQADIFDHIFSVVSEFGLKIYQQPSGSDIRLAGKGE